MHIITNLLRPTLSPFRYSQFLEVPIPSEPFPRVNDAAAMERFMGGMIKKGVLRWLMIIAGAAGAASVIIPKLQKLVRA